MKKGFKMPSSYAILFMLIIVLAIITWIVPGGQFNDKLEYVKFDEKNTQGLWQILTAPVQGFYSAVDIALFVLVIGGFIEIVMSTQALDAIIGNTLSKNKGKEVRLIPILMVMFGIGGSTFGMAEETIAFYPLLVPVLLAAGFDVVTAVMILLLGTGTGVLASTINPFAIGAASSIANVGVGDGIIGRVILFILVETSAIIFTMRYALKVQKDKSKSITADINDEIEGTFEEIQHVPLTSKHKVVFALFALTFVIMIIGVIPWASKFDIFIFEDFNNFLAKNLSFLGFKDTGAEVYWSNDTSASAFGDWWFGQMTTLFLIMSLVIGAFAKYDSHKFVQTFITGSRALLGVALIIGLSRGIKIILDSSGMDATLLYYGSNALDGLGKIPYIIFTYVFYLPMSFLIPSTSGLAGATMGIMAPLGESVYGSEAGIIHTITAYASANGVLNLITPTSGVVMGGLAVAKVPYDKWLKHVMPFVLFLSLLIILFLVVVTVTGFTG